MALQQTAIPRPPRPSNLADVLDLILDKGLVIDAYVRVSVIGIELLVVDARIVVASVDTYLRFAEAVNRLDLDKTKEATTYSDLAKGGSESVSEGGTKGAIEGMKDEFGHHEGNGKGKESTQERTDDQQKQAEKAEAVSSGKGSDRDGGRGEHEEGDGGGHSLLSKVTQRGRWST
jgi:gas vesicle structural protein